MIKTGKIYERKRFIKDSTKSKTDSFDPEQFKHDGFDDRERYLETYVPALADEERLNRELNNFTPPRVSSINDSPYQALVIRYGILRILIQQLDYRMEKEALLEAVQAWQQQFIEEYTEDDFGHDDDLLHLAKAGVNYGSDIDDSELHMVYSYFELHNRAQERKDEFYTWLDFFKRLSAIERFPKVSRSERPEHALDTIEKGLWSLQEQAIVYEIFDAERGDIVGIPEEYVDYIRDWLYYEMSEENFQTMLDQLAPFDKQATLIEARNAFGIDTKTQGLNQKRRESLVKAGVYPSELLREVLTKDELKAIVDEYGLDAHKQKTDEMIEMTIAYFEQSQKYVEEGEADVDLYLKCFKDIADGNVQRIPPQIQSIVDAEDQATKLEILFEEATAEIFTEVFNLSGTSLLGQHANGIVADGEIEQDGKWLLWDNKRRRREFKLGSNTQSKIKNYIDTKNQQHNVEWFLIIAPEFTEMAKTNANKLEAQLTEYKRFAGSEFADVRGRITDVEEQVQTLESSPDNATSEDADQMSSQTAETPLERICALPEQIADRELTTNQDRARFIARDVRDYAEKAPAGLVIDSQTITKVLTAAEGTKPHTQTVAPVMDFLEKLGKDEVKQTKRRGKKLVVVDPEAADRYHDRCDRPNEHAPTGSVMS